jgi:hypothetical protein
MYVFALMGMQFFAGELVFNEDGKVDKESGEDRRYNFDSIENAFVVVFQLLIGDDWNYVMYDWMRAVSDWAFVYFIFCDVISIWFHLPKGIWN